MIYERRQDDGEASFRSTLLELRRLEEARARRGLQQAQSRLETLRSQIDTFEQKSAELLAQAGNAFADGDDITGRGCRREAMGVRLERSRRMAALAEAKSAVRLAQIDLEVAIQRRQAVDRIGDARWLSGDTESQPKVRKDESRTKRS